MVTNTFVDNAKVMSKGQITIPKDVREVLGVSSGDRVTFIVEGSNVRIVNSAVYANTPAGHGRGSRTYRTNLRR